MYNKIRLAILISIVFIVTTIWNLIFGILKLSLIREFKTNLRDARSLCAIH